MSKEKADSSFCRATIYKKSLEYSRFQGLWDISANLSANKNYSPSPSAWISRCPFFSDHIGRVEHARKNWCKLPFWGAAMISSQAVFKGTFRLSIVAAVAAAAYTAYEEWQANVQVYNDTLQMVLTYECGGRQSDDTLRAALNGARIDLSKVGCSNQPFFWASYNEIVQAREGTLRRAKLSDVPMFRMNMEGAAAMSNAAIWFVLVNLLGVLFVYGRTVVRWVHRGLQEYLT